MDHASFGTVNDLWGLRRHSTAPLRALLAWVVVPAVEARGELTRGQNEAATGAASEVRAAPGQGRPGVRWPAGIQLWV